MAAKERLSKMPSKDRNPTFNCLQALLIIMVIDDHCGTRIGILSSVFPYNSFYMPFFVFISGYFYKERRIAENVAHKTRRILVPYILWNLAGNAVALVLHRLGIVDWYNGWSAFQALKMLLAAPVTTLIAPGWFAIMLFYVSIAYNILDNLVARFRSRTTDYAMLLAMWAAGVFSLWLCIHHYRYEGYFIVPVRTVFYIQFYHMGRMFSKYWKPVVVKWRASAVCAACALVNVALICLFGDRISFVSTAAMGAFKSCWLPLLTSITGGLFWYEVMRFLAPLLGQCRVVSFMAKNTFAMMMAHLSFVNLPNLAVYAYIRGGGTGFGDFDIAAFKQSAWYRYSANVRLVGFFCGLAGALLAACALARLKARLQNRAGALLP